MATSLGTNTVVVMRVRCTMNNIHINPFIHEFLKWTLPSLNLDVSIVANGLSLKMKTGMANGHYENTPIQPY